MGSGWRGTATALRQSSDISLFMEIEILKVGIFFDIALDLVLIIASGLGTQVNIFIQYLSKNILKEKD